jgi:3-oxoacyl-[acyl-carrier protein] reductase
MLTASFISALIGTKLGGPSFLCISQTLSFLKPARVGDDVVVIATVKSRSESQRVLKLETVVERTDGTRLIEGEFEVKVLPVDPEPLQQDAREHRPALVTGASRGVGAAIAFRLSEAGYPVAVNFLKDADGARHTVEKIQSIGGAAVAIQADVGDPESVAQLVHEVGLALGPPGVLVHSASPSLVQKSALDSDAHDLERYFRVHVFGLQALARAIVPAMVADGGGSIIVLGSTITDGAPLEGLSSYAASKSATLALCRSLAAELGPKNVRVNVVSPGLTDTRMTAELPEKAKMLEKFNIPLRRFATADDVANAVVFLAGSKASHITGTTLRVSGGREMI